MNEELKQIESSLTVLEANQKQIKLLKNKANYITNELEIFENNYIKSNWAAMEATNEFGIYGCFVFERRHVLDQLRANGSGLTEDIFCLHLFVMEQLESFLFFVFNFLFINFSVSSKIAMSDQQNSKI